MELGYLCVSFVVTLLLLQTEPSYGLCSGSTSVTSDSTLNFITSTNYPSYYPNGETCEWTLTTTSDLVLFYVESEFIERTYDFLNIYSGLSPYNTRLFYSETNDAPYVQLSSTNSLTITWTSDYSIQFGGFKIFHLGVTSLDSCGGTLTATNTPKQLTYVSRYYNSDCSWTISSSTQVKLTLTMVQGDVTIINAGSQSSFGTVGSVVISSTSDITVKGFRAYSNFVVTYEEVSSGSNSIVSTTASPYNQCTQTGRALTATSTTQYFSSKFYPSQYPNYQSCDVVISADDTQKSLYIVVNDYDLSYGDYLSAYDGPNTAYNYVYIYSGSTFTSSGYRVFIQFFTNSYGQNRGFLISYATTTRPDITSLITYTLEASFTASSTPTFITSPNYPQLYDNYIDMYWLITKPNQDDTIVIDLQDFNVENSLDCIYDKVTIYDGYSTSDPSLAAMCGYEPATFEDNTGLYILIRFETDGSVTKSGFSISFYIGSYIDPDSDTGAADGSDDGSGIPDYVYPIIIIGIILIVSVTVFIFVAKRQRRRVAASLKGQTKSNVQQRTTKQLLDEMTNKSKVNDKRPKVSRKKPGIKHPQPNIAGPNVTVINMGGQSPHPPPNQYPPPFGLREDMAYPPLAAGSGGNQPPQHIKPVFTNIPAGVQSAPLPPFSDPGKVPVPFAYQTPSEARVNGTYT